MAREITTEEKEQVREALGKARAAMKAAEPATQAEVDRWCQSVGWSVFNEPTAIRLGNMSVDESGMGDREPARRFKILGILRDALRQKSMGVIEELPEKGIVKYAKPAGVIASLIPVTSPYVTPASVGIYAAKCKDAVIFAPHPGSKKTTTEAVRLMRAALKRAGAPEDLFQCLEKPSIPLAQELMASCDLTIATGGQAMVRAAYSSGKPAYGVGAGNATMVIDDSADVEGAARTVRSSKVNDNGSGCSSDGNALVDSTIYQAFVTQLQVEGGYLVNELEKQKLQSVYWDAEGHRTANTIARPAATVAGIAGFSIPEDKKFLIVQETQIGKEHLFSSEKLGPVLAVFEYKGWSDGLDKVRRIYEVGGRGHSCGIYSFNDQHVHELALMAPVSRMMVRQPQSRSNAGTFTNGMPMTSSMGCGIWGGNITNENVSLKHYMNVTWVSRPIPEDRPSEAELFGEFLNSPVS